MFDLFLRVIKERVLRSVSLRLGKWLSPNQLTICSFICGLITCYLTLERRFSLALLFWLLNRVLDGLDGVVARVTNRQTDFGGYFDILVDFTIYALLPLVIVYGRTRDACLFQGEMSVLPQCGCALICKESGDWSRLLLEWIALALMEGAFFVNAASLMMLATILEKRHGQKGQEPASKQMTSVAMPSGLIEGAETVLFFALFVWFNAEILWLYLVFGGLVWATIVQRLIWARVNL